MQQSIQEFVSSQGQKLRVDAKRGVLRGVKLLGLTSRNGRTYQEAALAGAIAMYEGAKVNVNHSKESPSAPRDYQDRLGTIRSVQHRSGEGLFGDLHFNPKHALAEQLAWDAQHSPGQVGLSHNVLARTSRDGDSTVVEEITKVGSVDLVADPATTSGLFEQQMDEAQHTKLPVDQQLAEAREQLSVLQRQLRIYELLAEHDLPLPGARTSKHATSEAFLQSLANAANDGVLEALVADRAALLRESSPNQRAISHEQRWSDVPEVQPAATAKEFAATLRK